VAGETEHDSRNPLRRSRSLRGKAQVEPTDNREETTMFRKFTIAALLAGKVTSNGPTVLVLSGRNIDMTLHRKIVGGEMPSNAEQVA